MAEMYDTQHFQPRKSSTSETPVMRSIEPFIMFDLPETPIEPTLFEWNYD